jgi:hypothetical protein
MLASARALLGAELPEALVLRAHGTALELRHPDAADASLLLQLRPRWEAVLRGEAPEPAQGGAGDPLLVDLRRRLQKPPLGGSALDRAQLLAGLLPTLTVRPEPGSELLAGPLYAALLFADGERVVPVRLPDLAAHGLSWDEALARALANADLLTAAAPSGLLWFDLELGRVALTDFDDPAGAGRLLSPFFRSLLLRLFDGDCLAAAPTRDTLLACAPSDPEAVAWLREEAARRHAEGPFPLDPALALVDEAGVGEPPTDPFA